MRDYAVVANIKAEQKGIIDDVFDKGYEQGYQDGTKAKDGERGSIYYGGYSDGYKDGQKDALKAKGEIIASEIAACKKAYEKGLKHGQELRAKEAECAEACGMKRAWEAARKIYDIQNVAMVKELFGADANYTIHNFTASEVIEKIEAWEKVDCNNTNCKNCINHNDCDYEDEWKLRRRGIVPAPPKEKHSEKSYENCGHHHSGDVGCEAGGCSLIRENWIPQEKQDAPKMNVESIEVGDEVYQLDKNYTYIVTNTDDKIACFFSRTGHWGCRSISELHKTGRHFLIQEILDAMKNNSEENNDNDG